MAPFALTRSWEQGASRRKMCFDAGLWASYWAIVRESARFRLWGTSFTALQEQLGLRLEARKEQTELIVIDHVEKPDAN